MKKIAAVLAVFAVGLFSVAAFSNASGELGWGGDTTTNVSVDNHGAAVIATDASSSAKTGGNKASAYSDSNGGSSRAKGGMIVTGDADASTEVNTAANTFETNIDLSGGCGCLQDGDKTTTIDVDNGGFAFIFTRAKSKADTGWNKANGDSDSNGSTGSSRAKGGMIMTGNATAWTGVTTIANSFLTNIKN